MKIKQTQFLIVTNHAKIRAVERWGVEYDDAKAAIQEVFTNGFAYGAQRTGCMFMHGDRVVCVDPSPVRHEAICKTVMHREMAEQSMAHVVSRITAMLGLKGSVLCV